MSEKIRTVFIDDYAVASPARNMTKLKFVAESALEQGLIDIVGPSEATAEQLKTIHAAEYVDAFIKGTPPLCDSNNLPWSPALVKAVMMMNGGMLTAAAIAQQQGACANLAQGFHHAGYDQGSAYCTFNGLALIASMHPQLRVFVLDMDQHGGNGTEELSDRLENLTAYSIHGSLFGLRGGPRSHFCTLRGVQDNPSSLWDAMDAAFDKACRSDLLIYQAGVDCHYQDPHGSMGLTQEQLQERDQRVFSFAKKAKIPLVVTLAGGYQKLSRVVELHVETLRQMHACYCLSSSPTGL